MHLSSVARWWNRCTLAARRRSWRRSLNRRAQSIRNWVTQSERNAGRGDGGLTTSGREELNRLRRGNRQLRVEREILSKAAKAAGDRPSHGKVCF